MSELDELRSKLEGMKTAQERVALFQQYQDSLEKNPLFTIPTSEAKGCGDCVVTEQKIKALRYKGVIIPVENIELVQLNPERDFLQILLKGWDAPLTVEDAQEAVGMWELYKSYVEIVAERD